MASLQTRALVTLVAAGAAVALGVTATGRSTPAEEIELKRTEAGQILAQLRQLDADVELLVERYNGARVRLDEIESALEVNTVHLKLARRSYALGQKRLEARLVELYKADEPTALEAVLGAASLDDLIARIETVERVTSEDGRIVADVRDAKQEIAAREQRLTKARADQRRLVESLEAQRVEIERRIADRQRYYASVQDQIAGLLAEEKARQEQLRREAERLLAQQRAQASAAPAEPEARREGSGEPPEERSAEPAPPPPAAAVAEVAPPPPPPAAPPAPAPAPAAAAPAPLPPPAEPPPAPKYGGVVGIAMRYLGIPYRWGGASPSEGFDCSGLITYVYAQLGVSLPHHAATQYQYGVPVSKDQLQPGDLVFFNGLGHNGMYIGDGKFVHAPHTGDVVKISSLSDAWYAATWVGARRIV